MTGATTIGGAGAAPCPLAENGHVRELLGILRDNGRDPSGLAALIGHVSEMENFVMLAESRIAEMKSQLDAMKEIQDHPIRHALQNAIKALEAKAAEIRGQIGALKNSIVDGCKNAVRAFREKGASALDRLASFFNVRGELQSIGKIIDACIRHDDKTIAKIEAFSKEYHSTGLHLKNMGRALAGKPPIDAARESGKLAKAASAPFRANRAIQHRLKGAVTSMIGKVGQLEEGAAARRGDKAARATAKPTLAEKLKANKELTRQRGPDKPAPERARPRGLEV